jgi:hypothetical protein
MKRIMKWIRRLLRRDRWADIPTVSDLWGKALQRGIKRPDPPKNKTTKLRACTFFTLP